MLAPTPTPVSNPSSGTAAPPPAPPAKANGSANNAPTEPRRKLSGIQASTPSAHHAAKNKTRNSASNSTPGSYARPPRPAPDGADARSGRA